MTSLDTCLEMGCDHCIETHSVFGERYECVSNTAYVFCYDTVWAFIVMFACLWFINLLFFIIARCKGQMYSSCCQFCVSLVQNVLFCAFVQSIICMVNDPQPKFMAGFMLFFMSIQVNFITFLVFPRCFDSQNGEETGCARSAANFRRLRGAMFHSKKEMDDNIDDFDSYVAKAHANPPLIKIKGVCRTAVQTHKGVSIFDFKFWDYVPYETWRCESKPEEYKKASIIITELHNDFNITQNLMSQISIRKENFKQMSEQVHFEILTCYAANKVYNVKKHKVFGETSCYYSFLNSCFGKFIFVVSHIFGLSPVFENLFGMMVRKIEINTKRSISDTNEYPIPVLKPFPDIPGGESCAQMPPSQAPQSAIIAQQNMANQLYNQQLAANPAMQNQMMVQQNQMMMQQQQQQMIIQQQQEQIMMQQQQIAQQNQMLQQQQMGMQQQPGMPYQHQESPIYQPPPDPPN